MTEERSLRIAFRVGQFPRLSETFILSQVEGLAARGHRISVLADNPADDGAITMDEAARPQRVDYLLPRALPLARAYAFLPYRIRRAHAAAHERRICQGHDVVMCNFGWAGAAVARSVSGRRRRARLVSIFHGDDMSRTLAQAGHDVYAELFREADVLMPVSEFWRRRLIEMGAPAAKLTVHRMGVDAEAFAFCPRPPVTGRAFRLVTVGRLVEKKGTEITLRALARLRAGAPELRFEFEVLGEGPLQPRLERLRDELGLRDMVHFLGAQPHAVVATALARADAFVLPSVVAADGDMEGIPVALMEAMASGLPVISTRHSGIPELIEHGTSGLLAAERDVDGLVRQLITTMTDADARASFARAARRTIEQRFDNRQLNDRLEALLRSLAGEAREVAAVQEQLVSGI